MSKSEADVRLDVTIKAIEKQYGPVIKWLGDAAAVKRETISTGSLGLDNIVGNGGFERGLVAEFFGEPGAGKSFLGYSVMKEACAKGERCAIVDAENSLDPKLLLKLGLPYNQVKLVEGVPTGEGNLAIADSLISSGEFAIVMIDSVAALVPGARVEADYDQASIGLHARLMSAGLQKIVPVAKKSNTLLIFINQLRTKVGSYGNPNTTTGGQALPFYASYRVEVIGSPQTKSRQLTLEEGGEVYGHKTTFKVVKNKRNSPYRSVDVNLIYGIGYDTTGEVIDLGADLGIMNTSGSWYYYKDFKWQGKEAVRSAMMADELLKKELVTEVRAVLAGERVVQAEPKEAVVNAKPVGKKRKGNPE